MLNLYFLGPEESRDFQAE